ncbi:hypothetical protein DEU56DRAFT_984069 [Suillus clintonianus]|uniref:uncharacterized protein n=1 Tax=Suillus clintonianus TaxID=1904413 RepID=UPI001B8657E9|nr:uncharacterized protein DEU56DRAFT_984069 [Suillus clintonianus]KAG2122500.1 hypothetical protein DEU56DRAFT_984069 [Suillus clintonianus]
MPHLPHIMLHAPSTQFLSLVLTNLGAMNNRSQSFAPFRSQLSIAYQLTLQDKEGTTVSEVRHVRGVTCVLLNSARVLLETDSEKRIELFKGFVRRTAGVCPKFRAVAQSLRDIVGLMFLLMYLWDRQWCKDLVFIEEAFQRLLLDYDRIFSSIQPPDLLVSADADSLLLEALLSSEAELDFDTHYGLLAPSQTVVVRAYTDDTDDQILAELQPRFIVMFEPNLDFVRRIEVYRNSNPGMGVRVYFMIYQLSCEEHKYLAGLRREKDSFEKLIKERGSMLLPIFEDKHAGRSDAVIKTISTRLAGGRKELSTVASQVID